MDNFNNENNTQSTENTETTNNYYQDFTTDTTYQPDQTGYTEPVEEKTSGLAVAALVFGILAILTGCCTGCLGIVLGIVGIIFAVIDKKNGSNGVAKGGMVCSIRSKSVV